jgi:hypothetical protein
VRYSRQRRFSVRLDIIVAVHDGFALKNAILLNSKETMDANTLFAIANLIFFGVNTLMIVTNHYKHFDSLLRMRSVS